MKGKLDGIITAIEEMKASKGMLCLAWFLMLSDLLLMAFKDNYMGGVGSYSLSVVVVNLLIGGIICGKLEKTKG